MIPFADVLSACLGNEELVREFNRLNGRPLTAPPIVQAIDKSTGYQDEVARRFLGLVYRTWQQVNA